MKFWVGITDNSWFDFLAIKKPDEINFWRPSSIFHFKAIEPGALFLFKLHSPKNFIAGGGFFVRHSVIPLTLAWQAFGEKNGASSVESLLKMISRLRKDKQRDPLIGCTILAEPFFLPESEWIPVPDNWSPNLVQGKTYDTNEQYGKNLWEAVLSKIQKPSVPSLDKPENAVAREARSGYGADYLTKVRLGQGTFRILVTEAYRRRCSITGERTLPVLQSAHIKPFSESGPNKINNGLLLRSDLHILFDRGYVTIDENLSVVVSKRIKKEFENGRDYYALHGTSLKVLPSNFLEHPAKEFVQWHNENIFIE